MRVAPTNRPCPSAIAVVISRVGLRLLLVVLLLCPAPAIRAQQAGPTEYEVKAMLLLNFTRDTSWPSNAFASPTAPIVVGIVGKDPFGPELEKTFSRKTAAGRSIVLKRLSADQDLNQCHLLFVPASEKRRERDMLDKLKGSPVLTVGEGEDFLDHGGALRLLMKEDSVRFSVNLHAATAARLRINAHVLRLADSVLGRYE